MTPDAIRKLQVSLGLPATGVYDAATASAMSAAVTKAVSSNPTVQKYAGAQSPEAILNAFTTGDWSGVTTLSGKPFTDAQQKAAVAQARTALAPAYEAQLSQDTATTEDTLRNNEEQLGDFQTDQARQFGTDKDALDKNAADSGVLFSGSRIQKQNDLRTKYQTADIRAVRDAGETAATTARGYQYDYGNGAAKKLSSYYSVPGAASYDPSVAHGAVRSGSLAAAYDPSKYNFQGTKPVAQTAAVQTRAASLLANRANKLSLSGVGAKF